MKTHRQKVLEIYPKAISELWRDRIVIWSKHNSAFHCLSVADLKHNESIRSASKRAWKEAWRRINVDLERKLSS